MMDHCLCEAKRKEQTEQFDINVCGTRGAGEGAEGGPGRKPGLDKCYAYNTRNGKKLKQTQESESNARAKSIYGGVQNLRSLKCSTLVGIFVSHG